MEFCRWAEPVGGGSRNEQLEQLVFLEFYSYFITAGDSWLLSQTYVTWLLEIRVESLRIRLLG